MSSSPLPSAPLSAAEREILDRIAAQESATDPALAGLLGAADGPGDSGDPAVDTVPGSSVLRLPHPRLMVLLACLGALLGVAVLPAVWLLAVAAVGVLVIVPSVLVVWAVRQGRVDPDHAPGG